MRSTAASTTPRPPRPRSTSPRPGGPLDRVGTANPPRHDATVPRNPAERPEFGPLLRTYDSVAREIAGAIPAFKQVESQLVDAIRPFTDVMVRQIDTTDPSQVARARVVNQAINDYLDLLYEAFSGRGRPALRSARTLYEHLVNYRWVDATPAEAQRYCDQEAVGDLLAFELNTPQEEEFTGKARKSVRHWRYKQERRLRPAADAVMNKYPGSFEKRWASGSLFDRAQAHGLDQDYDTTYRLLSSVIHGSAGGDLGQRDELAGHQIVRTGPAVSACPFALRTGHRFFSMLTTDAERIAGNAPTVRLRELLGLVDDLLRDHRDVCYAIDADLWPDQPPTMALLLRVGTNGAWTWFLWDSEQDRTVEAAPTDMGSDDLDLTRDLVAAMEAANPGRTKPMVMLAGAFNGTPLPNARWRRAEATLGPKRGPVRHLQVRAPVRDPSLYD